MGIAAVAHGKGGHLQSGDPALGALFQGGNIFRGQLHAHQVVQEAGCLVRGEAQVIAAHFVQLATGTPTRQRELRVGAAGDDQVHAGRLMVEQVLKGCKDGRVADGVQVIQHQHEFALHQVIDQAGDEILRPGGLWGSQQSQGSRACFREKCLH